MPIPTSIIVVVLVVAWLAVLVPMVAKRREHVPEMDEDGGRFRVLKRASASLGRRKGRNGTVDDDELDADENDESEEAGEPEALEEQLLDDESDDLEAAELDEEPEPAPARREQVRARSTAAVSAENVWEARGTGRAGTVVAEPEYDEEVDHRGAGSVGAPHGSAHGHAAHDRSAAHPDPESAELGADERYRPVPQRRGRGGYDPEAAEATRAYKYKRRRRVTLILVVLGLLLGGAGYLLNPLFYVGAGVFGLLLVAYLMYLRRQVKIEEAIRQRRLARLRRARQIRPEYHPAAQQPVTSYAPVTRAAPPPPEYLSGRTVVEPDDDDPSFDELDYYEPVTYRRAAGQ